MIKSANKLRKDPKNTSNSFLKKETQKGGNKEKNDKKMRMCDE